MHILPTDHGNPVQKEENGGGDPGSREGGRQRDVFPKNRYTKRRDTRFGCASLTDSQRFIFLIGTGPTSAQHLLHSQAMIPPRTYESYDSRYNHTWEVSESGDGLIHVHEPTVGGTNTATPKQVDLKVDRDTIEKLLNLYFTEIAPIFPIVTQAEFLAKPSPSPLLLYSCCLVAAARRQFPQPIFDSIRHAANSVIKADDVLSTVSIVNVQSLLILCMVADSHSQFVPNALSALWVRAGTAIRMVNCWNLSYFNHYVNAAVGPGSWFAPCGVGQAEH